MDVVNALGCEPDETFGRGAFHARVFDLTERLGAAVIGATVWEMDAGAWSGAYHFHHGVEEWFYVVSGAPVLRDPDGERELAPGELVAFASGPAGAHAMRGPGRVLVFSAGARGWGEAFVTVYPDSDKIAAAPGVMFRRADAIETRLEDDDGGFVTVSHEPVASGARALDLLALEAPSGSPGLVLSERLGARTWTPILYELGPGEATAPYHYRWCREEWAVVLSGEPTLRRAGGETSLSAADVCCFPQGPAGSHQLRNDSEHPARLIIFSTSTDRPMSTFYPDEGTVLIQASGRERLLFREEDRIEDYWDGEAGARPLPRVS